MIITSNRSLNALSALIMLSLLLFILLYVEPAHAIPANTDGAVVKQPDGSVVTIYLRGDEHAHWNEDHEGYLVKKSHKSGSWVYAVEENGIISDTLYPVGKVNPKAVGIKKPDIRRIVSQSMLSHSYTTAIPDISAVTPSTGTLKNLVILVNFSDLSISYSRQQFDDLFNSTGYVIDGAVGSVRDYYDEISYGTLDVQSTVVEPVTLDYGYAYYGANVNGWDAHPTDMVKQALSKLDQRGFDFRTVDGNNDGLIDGLTIIHAGGGEEYSGNDSNYIWSHQGSLGNGVMYDKVRIQSYHTESARRGFDNNSSTWGITRIGVICHETGHFLGLPDLYDTGYDSSGAGMFCVMAAGSWGGGDGKRPVHMSAWCKAKLGWINPTVISAQGSNYSLPQVESNALAYKLQGPFAANEYFLVENRQGTGFDASLPGSSRGILIWHIDTSQTDNDNQARYMVDLEEASGTQHLQSSDNISGDDSDYFRSNTLSRFTNSTTPNNLSYSGVSVGLPIVGISASGATMSFSVGDTPPTGSVTVNNGAIYTKSNSVTLTLSATGSSQVTFMRFSSDGANWTAWEAYTTSKSWTLTTGDGSKTVYVQFIDAAGLTSTTIYDTIVLDTTPPTQPTAPIDAGAYTTNQLVAFNWSSSTDALSGISSYNCRIGSIPGGNDIFEGNVGLILTKALQGTYGNIYYCNVQAIDNAGNTSNWSNSSDGIVVVRNVAATIGEVKKTSDGVLVGLNSKMVTAIFADCIYIQDADRSSGIKVILDMIPAGLQIGSLIDIGGRLSTGSDGQRFITGTAVIHN